METQSCATHQYENYKLKIAESIIAISSFSAGKTPRCYLIHRASNWWMLSVIHNTWIWHTPRHVVFLMFETYDYSLWEETITVVSRFCISNILIYLNQWTEPRPHACIGYGFLHRFVRSDDRKYSCMVYKLLTYKHCTSKHAVGLRVVHYNDVIMTTIVSQITSLTVVYSIVNSDANQRKHQSSASLAFVWGIHRDRWIPLTKDQLRGKCFHLMTSSCVSCCQGYPYHLGLLQYLVREVKPRYLRA